MDKDTLRAIEIIREILGLISAEHKWSNYGLNKIKELDKIINGNKEE